MKTVSIISAVAAMAMITFPVTAEAQMRVKARGQNGTVTAATNGKGGAVIRGRGKVENADGSTTIASGGARRTAEGGRAVRAGTATYNDATGEYSSQRGGAVQAANGATASTQSSTSGTRGQGWTRTGSSSASGEQGSVSTSSNYTRGADGGLSGGSETTVTGNASGITYTGSTTIDPATGKPVHSYSCTDTSGAAVTCPQR